MKPNRAAQRTCAFLAVLLLLGITGCAAGSASSARDPNGIVIAIYQEPTGVDPCNYENALAVPLKNNVVQALTDLDPGSDDLRPLLAVSWKQDDPLTWTFQLRQGVKFHDGTPFDAAAAVFGINRALNNKKVSCSDTAKIAAGVKITPTAVNAGTLRVTTNIPDPIVPLELSYVDLVSPKTPMDRATDDPIGTGPYEWAGWVRGSYYEVRRWDGYWGPKAELTSVRVVFRSEDSVRANMVKTGEADIAFPIAPQDATSDDRTREFPRESTVFYRLPVQTAPFNDMRVREAAQLAVDKPLVVSALLERSGVPSGQIVPKSVNGYLPGYAGQSYDPDRARQLLAQAKAAGVPVDRPIDLVGQTDQFQGSDEVMQAIYDALKKVGFNVNLRTVDAGQWKQLLFKPYPPNQTPTILQTIHKNVSGDASSTFTSYLATAGCCGTAQDPQLDALISKAGQASGDQRIQLYRQVSQLEYSQDMSILPLAELSQLLLLSNRVEYQPNRLTASYEMLLSDVHLKH
jgi:peptide/nickel transport system substrate-binding protein